MQIDPKSIQWDPPAADAIIWDDEPNRWQNSVARGVGTLGESAVQAGGVVAEGIASARDWLQGGLSAFGAEPPAPRDNLALEANKFAQAMRESKDELFPAPRGTRELNRDLQAADGFWDSLAAYARNQVGTAQMGIETLVSSVPAVRALGAVGGGAILAGGGAGVDAGAQFDDEFKQGVIQQTPEYRELLAQFGEDGAREILKAERITAVTGAAGAAGGLLAGITGGLGLNPADEIIAGKAAGAARPGFVATVAREAVGEVPEEVGTQLAGNIAASATGSNKPVTEGLGAAAAGGLVLGAAAAAPVALSGIDLLHGDRAPGGVQFDNTGLPPMGQAPTGARSPIDDAARAPTLAEFEQRIAAVRDALASKPDRTTAEQVQFDALNEFKNDPAALAEAMGVTLTVETAPAQSPSAVNPGQPGQFGMAGALPPPAPITANPSGVAVTPSQAVERQQLGITPDIERIIAAQARRTESAPVAAVPATETTTKEQGNEGQGQDAAAAQGQVDAAQAGQAGLLNTVAGGGLRAALDGMSDADLEAAMGSPQPAPRMTAVQRDDRIAELQRQRDSLDDAGRAELLDHLVADRDQARVMGSGAPIEGVRKFAALDAREKSGEAGGFRLFFDGDNFKRINDSFGHAMGDEVIRGMGEIAARIFPDAAFHKGGDEFVVEGRSEEELQAGAERMRQELANTEFFVTDADGKEWVHNGVQVSIGIGRTTSEAEQRQYDDKRARAAAGIRTERGADRRAAGVDQPGQLGAGTDRQWRETSPDRDAAEAAGAEPVAATPEQETARQDLALFKTATRSRGVVSIPVPAESNAAAVRQALKRAGVRGTMPAAGGAITLRNNQVDVLDRWVRDQQENRNAGPAAEPAAAAAGPGGGTGGARGDRGGAVPGQPGAAERPAVTRKWTDREFNPAVHDLIDFIALKGGLDRDAMASEGIDPAYWNSAQAQRTNMKFVGKPLFRKGGGMTADGLREAMQSAGFLPEDPPNAPPRVGSRDALDMLDNALRGRKYRVGEGQDAAVAAAENDRYEQDRDATERFINALPPAFRDVVEADPELLAEAMRWAGEDLDSLGLPYREDAGEPTDEEARTLEEWLIVMRDAGVDAETAERLANKQQLAWTVEEGAKVVAEIAAAIQEASRGSQETEAAAGEGRGDRAQGLQPAAEPEAEVEAGAGADGQEEVTEAAPAPQSLRDQLGSMGDAELDALLPPDTPAEKPANPDAIPGSVKFTIRWAVGQLNEVRAQLEGVERARGRGHILALEWRDQQEKIGKARAKLEEVRNLGRKNGEIASVEAYIKSLGGEPDLERYNVTPAPSGAPRDENGPRTRRPVTPQVASARQLESFISIAADSVSELRRSDVDRVLSGAPVQFRASLAAHIKASRVDLASEVDDVMADLDAPRSARQAATPPSDGLNLSAQGRSTLDQLQSLFGPPDGVREDSPAYAGYTPEGVDLAKYRQAKPLFDALLLDAEQNGQSAPDFIRALVAKFGDNHVAKAMIRAYVRDPNKGVPDAPGGNTDLAGDRTDAGNGDGEVGAPVSDGGRGPRTGTGRGGRGSSGGRSGSPGVRGGRSAAAGERGNQPVDSGERPTGPAGSPAGTDVDPRGGGFGDGRAPVEPAGAKPAPQGAGERVPDSVRREQQRAASALPVKRGDLANIRDTLPYLLPGQQEDVHKAETRFAKPDGYGMLFTNGTGTGKTFTGLGVVKRFAMEGRDNIIIIAPNDKIIEDWQRSGEALGLTISRLKDTQSAGSGIVITTYAGFGQNDSLANRAWDLVVADEAHYLSQEKTGKDTLALDALRAISLHPRGAGRRLEMLHGDIIRKRNRAAADAKMARMSDDQRDWATAPALQEEADRLSRLLDEKRKEIEADIRARQGEKRTRATFLSATPFAYEKTVDWAEGYLFSYGEDPRQRSGAYNTPGAMGAFMIQHFGYRMRHGKLTEPDAKVDRGLMQRQFNAWLKREGYLSGRTLDVPFDYDRRFQLVESAIGRRVDEAIAWIRERAYGNGGSDAFRALNTVLSDRFDHLARRYLLEAIKARESVRFIRAHLALGRKVVVFHDFKKGDEQRNPLKFDGLTGTTGEANRTFLAEFGDLVSALDNLKSPITTLSQAFPGLLLFNGDVSPKDRRANVAKFNSDESGPQVILVQSAAGKEGISLHDTTGKHQRALLNLGLPTQPTTSIQQEGRIFRTGQASDAILRYFNTGTNWERWAFATTIAQRASAAENLAAGESARALKDAFINAFEESDDFPPGHEGEGTGGKELDRLANAALTEWDRAKSFYFGQQKKTSKTKAAEGEDYFATPEPVGLKMVQWLDLRPGEKALEPSGGHGAIARWLPENVDRTAVEPSPELRSRMAMVFDGKIVDGRFEDLHVVNKFDGIVMNPPFGTAGRTAIDHLAKAATHLNDGGRIVALIPTGPAADAKFDKWFYEERETSKPIFRHPVHGPIYKGDTIVMRMSRGVVTRLLGDGRGANAMIEAQERGYPAPTAHLIAAIDAVEPGPRESNRRVADGLFIVADIKLPSVTFERAGAKVMTRIVVIEKPEKGADSPNEITRDYSSIEKIDELFDRLQDLDLKPRAKPVDDAGRRDQRAEAGAAATGPVSIQDFEVMASAARGDALDHVRSARRMFEDGDFAGAADMVSRAKRVTTDNAFQDSAIGIVERLRSQAGGPQSAAAGGKVAPAGQFKHTRTGADVFVAKINGRVERDEYDRIAAAAKAGGGYYSSFKGGGAIPGFHFKTSLERDTFLAAVNGTAPPQGEVRENEATYSRVHVPIATGGDNVADRKSRSASAAPVSADLFTPAGTPAATGRAVVSAAKARAIPVAVGTVSTGIKQIDSWLDAAHVVAPLRKIPQEQLLAVVADKSGRLLAVVRHTIGMRTSASADVGTLFGTVASIPGARQIWMAHNHPGGDPAQSGDDRRVIADFANLADGTGIKLHGSIVVAPGSRNASFIPVERRNAGSETFAQVPAANRTSSVDVLERRYRTIPDSNRAFVGSPASAIRLVSESGVRNGFLMLDARHRYLGAVEMDPGEMGKLRTGDPRTGAAAIAGALTDANADAVIAVTETSGYDVRVAVDNLKAMLTQGRWRLLDHIEAGVSREQRGEIAPSSGIFQSRSGNAPAGVRGMSVDAVQAIASGFTSKIGDALGLRVVVMPSLTAFGSEWALTRGAYHAESETVFLGADMLESPADALETLRHEVVGHYGLDALGQDAKDEILGKIVESKDAPGMRDLWAKVNRLYGDRPEIERAEEVFAHAAQMERGTLGQAWDKILSVLAKWLRKAGLIRGMVTMPELRRIAARIADGLRDGERAAAQYLRNAGMMASTATAVADGQPLFSRVDLLGDAPTDQQQAIARARERIDAKLRGDGRGYVAPSEGPGDLFGGPRAEQAEMFGPARDLFGNPVNQGSAVTAGTGAGVAHLKRVMRDAGWEIEYVDLDLTGEKPTVDIRINRMDGRYLTARVDSIGRGTIETFQRERTLGMTQNTRGRRPLSPQVNDVFLGRQKFSGARQMLRGMTNYLADNSTSPVEIEAIRSAWGGVMGAPTRIAIQHEQVQQDGFKFSRMPPGWDPEQQAAARKTSTFAARTPIAQRWQSIRQGIGERLTQRIFDQFKALQRLSPEAFMQAHLSRGTDGTIEAVFTEGPPRWDHGAFNVDAGQGGFQKVLSDLDGEHDQFLLWVAGNRAEMLLAQGREHLFDQTDIAALKRMNQGTMPDGRSRALAYAQAHMGLKRYMKAHLDIAEAAGLIDGQSRHLWEHDFYVPFYRVLEDDTSVSPGHAGGLLRQRAFQRLKGGQEPLGDLLANTLANWSHLLTASMKNSAAQKAMDAAVATGVATLLQGPQKGSVWIMRNGVQEHYQVHDPLALEAMQAISFTGFRNSLMDAMGTAKRVLTMGVTISPSFRIRNAARDTLSALATADVGYNPVANIVNGWAAMGKGSATRAAMIAGGGSVRFGAFNDGDQAQHAKRMVSMGIQNRQILDTSDKIKNALRWVWDQWQEVGDRVESINRSVIYQRAIAEGKTHLEASFAARDLMNFTSMGSSTAIRALAQILPFFNARLQGMYRLGRGAKADPRRFIAVTGALAMVSAMLFLMNQDDEEYQSLPDYVRDGYWPIKLGGKWFYVPKPFEVGALATVVERGTEMATAGTDYQAKDFATTVGSVLVNQLAMHPVPQLFKPIGEAWANYDAFRQAPIDSPWEDGSDGNKFDATTSAGAIAAGQALDVSPRKIEHLVRGYFGWLGTQALNASDWMMRDAMDLPSNPRRDLSSPGNLFVVGDFLKDARDVPSKYVQRFYDMQEQIDRVYADVKRARQIGDDAEVERLQETPEMQARGRYSSARTRMQGIGRQIRQISADKELTAAQKNEQIRELQRQRNELARQVDMDTRAGT